MVSLSWSMICSTLLAAATLAMPTRQQHKYSLRTVHQFPNYTWIENMAIRSNGQILATNIEGGNVFLVDPFQSPDVIPPVIASFGEKTAIAGIAEVECDVFYVQGVRNSTLLSFEFPGNSSAMWKIDMRPYAKTGQAHVSKVTDIPEIAVPNGLTLLSKEDGTLLIADSGLGKIWRFRTRDNHYEVVNDDALLKPVQGMFPEFGVNGLKVIGSTLYFSSLNQGVLGTFPIDRDGRPTGVASVISSSVPDIDDFAVGPDGSVWLAENISNTLVRAFPDGSLVTVAGGQNSTELIGPVSARFGRTPADQHILYVSTDGLTFGPNGPLTTNGKIAAINTLE